MVNRGDVLAAMLGSSGSSSNDQTKSKSSEWIPNKLKHWGVYVGSDEVISLNGDGEIVSDSIYGECWDSYEIHSSGDDDMADVALELYSKYKGKCFFKYTLIVTDCQTFITYVNELANQKSKTYRVAKVLTLGIGTSIYSAIKETRNNDWISFHRDPLASAVGVVAKVPGYFISTIVNLFRE